MPKPANSIFDLVRAKRIIIALSLDFLPYRGNAISLLLKKVEVVNQKIWLRDASSVRNTQRRILFTKSDVFRVTQSRLLLAKRYSLLAYDFVASCLTLKSVQFQIVDQVLNLRTWLFYPSSSAPRTEKQETCDQGDKTHFFVNHDVLRIWRKETINIRWSLPRFHRIECAKRSPSFLHPNSVGSSDQVDMLVELSERGAVCASA